MKLSVRFKLLVTSLVFITVVDIVVGAFLEHQLRTRLEDTNREQLARQARTLVAAESALDFTAGAQVLDPVADRLGEAMQARVTLIDPSGVVVGDSEVELDRLSSLDNHASRPEVVASHGGEVGISRRTSSTVGVEMLYAAVELPSGSVARVAVPVAEVDDAVSQMRVVLLGAGVVAFFAAGALSLLLPYLLSRGLRQLVRLSGSGDEPSDAEATRPAADLERALRSLADERNRLTALLQTMDQGVVAIDDQMRITTVNRAARELLELPRNVRGRLLLDYVRTPAIQELLDAKGEGKQTEAEIEHGVTPRRRLRVQVSRRRGGNRALVFADVTNIRRLETFRRDLVANVSHELRTPIAVIRANAETLADGALEDPKHAKVFVDAMARQAERLGNLVADLLDISRIEAGRYDLVTEPIALDDVCERALANVRDQMQRANIDIDVALPPDCRVLADGVALEQILTNLLENAIRYGGDGRPVEVRAEDAAGVVRVEVRDDGPGIDPKHRVRIFERFYRADPGRSRAMGGTGLGLSIVRNLVESMGGEVGVLPRRPRGSVFWFTLPRS